MLLDIGEVAARSGLTPSALRHYEQAGLISPAGRHGLRRQYAPEVLVQLKLIALGQSAGFALGEIAGMFGGDGQPELPREVFRQKADAIDRQIAELTALRETLRHIAECRAPSHMECPTFRRLIDHAGSPERRRRTSPPPSQR